VLSTPFLALLSRPKSITLFLENPKTGNRSPLSLSLIPEYYLSTSKGERLPGMKAVILKILDKKIYKYIIIDKISEYDSKKLQ